MARKTLPSATSLSPISQDLYTGGVILDDQFYADAVLLPVLLPKGKQFTEVAGLRIVEETCWLARSGMPQSDYICLWRFNSYLPKCNFNIYISFIDHINDYPRANFNHIEGDTLPCLV